MSDARDGRAWTSAVRESLAGYCGMRRWSCASRPRERRWVSV
ncbi:MAG: hypothetical protein U0324_19930 [Polyangiales bacterium]